MQGTGWRLAVGFGVAAATSAGFAWFGRANGDVVLLGSGLGVCFAGLAVPMAVAAVRGLPVPSRLAGPCLVISGVGATVAWLGRAPIRSEPRDPSLLLLFFAVVFVSLGVGLLLRPAARPTSSTSPVPAASGLRAIDAARDRHGGALDADALADASRGPAWVWFPGHALTDDPGAVCWDWYSSAEEWPAGRESPHVADASATTDELRQAAAGFLTRDEAEVRLVLARRTIVAENGQAVEVTAYLVR
ncbi:MAG: hypothetical protein IE926_12160 [Micrococcales bacterium]|nr:hypothetical protein [Micrococcales bacterium]